MKNICTILFASLLFQNGIARQSLRNITDVNNKTTSIDSLQGRKLLIIVLPSQTDTALNNQLLRFQNKYSQKVKVIALVNVQPGTPSKELYATTYAAASQSGVIVSEGIANTGKVDNERASIIQWMTSRSNNRQQDRYAIGSKYFLSEDGRLYAKLGKETSLDDPLIKCIVNTVVPQSTITKTTPPNPKPVVKPN
jgi:hypothetical protein